MAEDTSLLTELQEIMEMLEAGRLEMEKQATGNRAAGGRSRKILREAKNRVHALVKESVQFDKKDT